MAVLQTDADPREEFGCPAPIEDLWEVEIDGPQRKVKIGATLSEERAQELIDLLKEYKELFAWSPSDMP